MHKYRVPQRPYEQFQASLPDRTLDFSIVNQVHVLGQHDNLLIMLITIAENDMEANQLSEHLAVYNTLLATSLLNHLLLTCHSYSSKAKAQKNYFQMVFVPSNSESGATFRQN